MSEVHIRFEDLVEFLNSKVQLISCRWTIVHVIHFCAVNKVIIELDLICEEWLEVRSIHKLSLGLINLR